MLRKQAGNYILISLIILENLFLFVFYHQGITSQTVNAIGYFSTSLLFGLMILFRFYKIPEISVYASRSKKKYPLIILYAACFLLLNAMTIRVIKTNDFRKMSDIIPTIQLIVKSFLSGNSPYSFSDSAHPGYSGPPAYLPMHWLPYSVAEFFHFDYRTITFMVWFSGALFVMLRSMRCRNILLQLLIPVLLSGCYMLLYYTYPGIIGCTVETMVCGYYMLLIIGLNQKNMLFTGFIMGVCVLSRYYIVFWLPLFAFALFVSGRRIQLGKSILAGVVTVSVIYIIPFLSKDWSVFTTSLQGYDVPAFGEWGHLNEHHLPYHLYYGTGFAHLFYEKYLHTGLLAGFYLLKKAFFISISVTLLALGSWYWFNRKKIDNRIFLLASFKIYLSVFLAFILVPYVYLMLTANFVSIAIFAEQARYRLAAEPIQ